MWTSAQRPPFLLVLDHVAMGMAQEQDRYALFSRLATTLHPNIPVHERRLQYRALITNKHSTGVCATHALSWWGHRGRVANVNPFPRFLFPLASPFAGRLFSLCFHTTPVVLSPLIVTLAVVRQGCIFFLPTSNKDGRTHERQRLRDDLKGQQAPLKVVVEEG